VYFIWKKFLFLNRSKGATC